MDGKITRMRRKSFPNPLPEHELSKCTEQEKLCVWRYVQGATQRQVAEKLGISQQAVSSHLQRALAAMNGQRPWRAKRLSLRPAHYQHAVAVL
jgi:DNA-binding CsgD family transcriptional regulator